MERDMALVKLITQIATNTKDSITWTRDTASENIAWQMGNAMKVNTNMAESKATESILGPMGINMSANG